MYKLAIFDFDGTLVDSAPGILEVMQDVITEYEMPQHTYDTWKNLVGVPLPKQVEIVFPEKSTAFHKELADRYRAIYDTKAIEICPPFPGLMNMLNSLKDSGVTVTIASSKRRNLVEIVLDHHNISDFFTMVVGAQDVTNHKPHPESVDMTMKKLAVKRHHTVVIGDASFDLDMARAAGVDAIGVTTGVHPKEVLALSEPRHIVGGLEEVLPIILNGKQAQVRKAK